MNGSEAAPTAKSPAAREGRRGGIPRGLRGGLLLAATLALWGALDSTALAQPYFVTNGADDGTGGTANTLSAAIIAANSTGGTIFIQTNVTLSGSLKEVIAPNGLPITIDGGGFTLNAAGNQAFTITPYDQTNHLSELVSISDLTIQNGKAQGGTGGTGNGGGGGGLGAGGAIYIDQFGKASVQNVVFQNNQAVGGTGGNATGTGNGGNGGGYNANANSAGAGTGGGAGGAPGEGGDAGYAGGGGGDGSSGTGSVGGAGNGGGDGGGQGVRGKGGLALGGAVFVGNGGTLTIKASTNIASTNTVTPGAPGTGNPNPGIHGETASGGGLYVGIGTNAMFDTSGADITISGNVFSNGHVILNGGAATVNFLGTAFNSPDYAADTTVTQGTLNGTTASIQGPIATAAPGIVRFTQTATGVFDGVISGSGSVQVQGTGTVVFAAANSYTGGTTVGGSATLQGTTSTLLGSITDNSTVAFVQNTNGTFSGSLSGTGNVVKSGTGTVTMGTTTYGGVTTINQGKLTVNGTNQSDFLINANGTLGGNSTINGNLVNSGTLAPGNSIGTTTVAGNFTANAGSTQQIEISPSAAPVPGTNNDLISVGGTATINGGTVAVHNTGGTYTGGATYTFLQSGGARTGVFSSITDDLTFFDANLVYGANSVAFQLVRNNATFAPFAQTANQQRAAQYIDQTGPTASGDYATVVDSIASLSSNQIPNALDQVSGQVYASGGSLGVQHATYMVMALRRQTRLDTLAAPAPGMGEPLVSDESGEDEAIVLVSTNQDGRGVNRPMMRVYRRPRPVWNGWTAGYGTWNNGIANGGNFGSVGSLTSIYREIVGGLKFGMFGAYNHVRFEQGFPTQSVSADDGQFGSYLRCDDGSRYLLLATSYGFDSYQSRREIQFGAINRIAAGSYGGWQTTQYGEFGAKIADWPMDIEPFVGLQYSFVRQNPFSETGADSLNLNVDGIESSALRSLFGSHFSTDMGTLRPEMRFIYMYDYFDGRTTMNSTFVGVGGAGFRTQGIDLGRSWSVIGAGLSWQATERLSLTANYDALINRESTFHMGSGSLQFHW